MNSPIVKAPFNYHKNIRFFDVSMMAVWLIILSTQPITVILGLSILYLSIMVYFRQSALLLTLKITWPIIVLSLWGLMAALPHLDIQTWPYIRDFVYLIKIPLIVFVTIGLLNKTSSFSQVSKSIFLASILLSILYLVEYMSLQGWEMSRRELRITIGRGYYLTLFGLMIAVFRPRDLGNKSLLNEAIRLFSIFLILIAALASTSRGIFLIPAFMLIAYATTTFRVPFRPVLWGGLIVVFCLSFPPIYLLIGEMITTHENSSFREMFSSEFGSKESIQAAFRSYEAITSWKYFSQFQTIEKLFGVGFGSYLELGVAVSLGTTNENQEVLRQVPITHISTMTALIKFGWVGAALYLYGVFPFYLKSKGKSVDNITLVINRTAIFLLLFTILTFQGFFAHLDLLNISIAMLAISQKIGSRKFLSAKFAIMSPPK